MVIGYILESLLGFLFAAAYAMNGATAATHSPTKTHILLEKGCATFFDFVIFFVISIQTSCMVVLIRKDYGISGDNFGGLTIQIAWIIGLISMLPLLFPMVILKTTESRRSTYRLLLFCACLIPFMYNFGSQMVGYFGPNQVCS